MAILEVLRNHCVNYYISYCFNCCNIFHRTSNNKGPLRRGAVAGTVEDAAANYTVVGAIVDAIVDALLKLPVSAK